MYVHFCMEDSPIKTMVTPYTEEYFMEAVKGARKSAGVVVPLVLQLLQPRSVVDVGCGSGEWLSAFREHGIRELLGIDNSAASERFAHETGTQFLKFDLARPFALERRFDLVVSLEVAEHLPPENAETFITSLTKLGPVVLFSAAIPNQGGVNHLNEQWPEYWAQLFHNEGFDVADPFRRQIWHNSAVEVWYAQNTLLFIENGYLKTNQELQREVARATDNQLGLVHPRLYLEISQKERKHRRTVDNYVAEVETLKTEIQRHRETAEYYIVETETLKSEVQKHRETAEYYYAEAERLKPRETQE